MTPPPKRDGPDDRHGRRAAPLARPRHVRLSLVFTGVLLLGTLSCHRPRPTGAGTASRVRALWVTRWDYTTASDIAAIMDRCRRSGFNTVLFQVRGNGTVAYPSRLEPWAREFGGRNPGFDPLQVACREARRRGLSLHAWVNVMPGWRGDAPPSDPRQLYNAHPAWFWVDARGRRQPLGWYDSLNPCLPEVRKYLVEVMREIVRRYPVDGLHMDYIRFPNEWHEMYAPLRAVPDYPRDRRTLALFARDTRGARPDAAPARWNAWRTAQVTQLVRDIRTMMRRERPSATLSAAVGALPDEALRLRFQDARTWIDEGLIDAVYPMNYSAGMTGFERGLRPWVGVRSRVSVVIGIMFDQREPARVNRQIDRAVRTCGAFAAFAYNSLFERRAADGRALTDAHSPGRAALRRSVLPVIRRLAEHDARGRVAAAGPR